METEKAILIQLITTLREQMHAELDRLPFTPKIRQAVKDGYSDGIRVGVWETVKLLNVTVKGD